MVKVGTLSGHATHPVSSSAAWLRRWPFGSWQMRVTAMTVASHTSSTCRNHTFLMSKDRKCHRVDVKRNVKWMQVP